jgi:predicted transcriptional regulator
VLDDVKAAQALDSSILERKLYDRAFDELEARDIQGHRPNVDVRHGTEWKHVRHEAVGRVMEPAFPFIDISTGIDALATMITPETPAVLVRDFKTDKTFIITRADVMRML